MPRIIVAVVLLALANVDVAEAGRCHCWHSSHARAHRKATRRQPPHPARPSSRGSVAGAPMKASPAGMPLSLDEVKRSFATFAEASDFADEMRRQGAAIDGINREPNGRYVVLYSWPG